MAIIFARMATMNMYCLKKQKIHIYHLDFASVYDRRNM